MSAAVKRRRAKASGPVWPNSLPSLTQAMSRLHKEGQGVWQLDLVSPLGAAEWLGRATAGDEWAMRLLRGVGAVMVQVEAYAAPDLDAGPQCLLCDAVFWRDDLPGVIAMLAPHRDEPSAVVISGVCKECCTRHGGDLNALKPTVLEKYRREMIGDLRQIPTPSAPGRA